MVAAHLFNQNSFIGDEGTTIILNLGHLLEGLGWGLYNWQNLMIMNDIRDTVLPFGKMWRPAIPPEIASVG